MERYENYGISPTEQREICHVIMQFARFRGHYGYFSVGDIARFYYPKKCVDKFLDGIKAIALDQIKNGKLVAMSKGRVYNGKLSNLKGPIELRLA